MRRAAFRSSTLSVRYETMRGVMNTKSFTLMLVGALWVMLAACSPKPGSADRGAQDNADPNRPIVIENFSLGTRLGPHGGIATGAGERMFPVGQLIYVAMELKNAPVGTVVHVVWKAQGDLVLGEETKEVRRNQRFMNFAADSSSLPLEPKYHVEVFVNGKPLAKLDFGLVLAAA
jgi:hypothetical protein